jgi:hypothetical protein
MILAKWDRDKLMKLSEQLGFDTEHPMIKIEMSQIIRKGGLSVNKNAGSNTIGGFGYQEIEVKFDPDPVPIVPDQDIAVDAIVNGLAVDGSSITDKSPQPPVQHPEDTEDEFKLFSPLYMIGIAGIFILFVGVYFIVSALGRKR